MDQRTTSARPYARAAFACANNAGDLAGWSHSLQIAVATMATSSVRDRVAHPRCTINEAVSIFSDIGGEHFSPAFSNFLTLLAERGRLPLLGEILAQYEQLRRQAESRVLVQVRSAQPMDEAAQQHLIERLQARFGQAVDMELEIDPDLIGGAVIRAGDQVIDGSVRGRLQRLAREMAV
jgi:F-type H+-transporting ATPase subunit delta